jgi:hypothetical protein
MKAVAKKYFLSCLSSRMTAMQETAFIVDISVFFLNCLKRVDK